MWIRITCPNGHPLERERLEEAARSKRCPACKATVSMWTKVTCPAGHTLKVRTKHGGGKGTCPECKAAVEIPEFDIERIIDVLLPKGPKGQGSQPPVDEAPPPAKKKPAPPAAASYYMPSLKAQQAVKGRLNCIYCQAVRFPGDIVCSNCGRAAPD